MLPKKVAQSWLRLRSLQKKCSFLAQLQVHPGNRKAVGWFWKGSTALASSVDNIEPVWQNNDALKSLHLKLPIPLNIAVVEELYRFVPMHEYGLLGRLVGGIVGNPVTHTYRVRISGLEDCTDAGAIMEVAFSDS